MATQLQGTTVRSYSFSSPLQRAVAVCPGETADVFYALVWPFSGSTPAPHIERLTISTASRATVWTMDAAFKFETRGAVLKPDGTGFWFITYLVATPTSRQIRFFNFASQTASDPVSFYTAEVMASVQVNHVRTSPDFPDSVIITGNIVDGRPAVGVNVADGSVFNHDIACKSGLAPVLLANREAIGLSCPDGYSGVTRPVGLNRFSNRQGHWNNPIAFNYFPSGSSDYACPGWPETWSGGVSVDSIGISVVRDMCVDPDGRIYFFVDSNAGHTGILRLDLSSRMVYKVPTAIRGDQIYFHPSADAMICGPAATGWDLTVIR